MSNDSQDMVPHFTAPELVKHLPAHVREALVRGLVEHSRGVMEPPRGAYVDDCGNLLKKQGGGYVALDPHQDKPHSSMRVFAYIREGLGWAKDTPYLNTGKLELGGFEWCGAFMAYCYAALKPEIRKQHCASTYRLLAWCEGTPRKVALNAIQAGDVVVVGKATSKRWGAHITICESVEDGYVRTIEGNGHGTLGTGEWGEGVVRRRRPFKAQAAPADSYVMHAYRFLPEDFGA